jgi:hypothetical protein
MPEKDGPHRNRGTRAVAEPVLRRELHFCKRLPMAIRKKHRIVPEPAGPLWSLEDGPRANSLHDLENAAV